MLRIGNGYDVHRLELGRKLILGGVCIPHEKGLLGHSDADVLVHAIMDSILGALSLGDIGGMFPDSDSRYMGISSLTLLEEVKRKYEGLGYKIGNADSVIIAQSPKLSPFIGKMRENIAEALDTGVENISVKATTEEFLGFTGAGEGIAAHAVCLLRKKGD